MNNKLLQRERLLAQRRHALLARSQLQRTQICAALGGIEPQLAGAERAFRLGSWVRRHATWISLAAGALLAIKRPRGVLKLLAQAWSGWRMLKSLTR